MSVTEKPSETIRNWPNVMWTTFSDKYVDKYGNTSFCAAGILAEVHGHAWGKPDSTFEGSICQDWYSARASQFLLSIELLTDDEIDTLIHKNDSFGKNAAADYLESLGK